LAAIDRLFIAVNQDGVNVEGSNGNNLMRYEFLEAIVRLAKTKYVEVGATSSLPEAYQMLIDLILE